MGLTGLMARMAQMERMAQAAASSEPCNGHKSDRSACRHR
jgi:hypothetical protein